MQPAGGIEPIKRGLRDDYGGGALASDAEVGLPDSFIRFEFFGCIV